MGGYNLIVCFFRNGNSSIRAVCNGNIVLVPLEGISSGAGACLIVDCKGCGEMLAVASADFILHFVDGNGELVRLLKFDGVVSLALVHVLDND